MSDQAARGRGRARGLFSHRLCRRRAEAPAAGSSRVLRRGCRRHAVVHHRPERLRGQDAAGHRSGRVSADDRGRRAGRARRSSARVRNAGRDAPQPDGRQEDHREAAALGVAGVRGAARRDRLRPGVALAARSRRQTLRRAGSGSRGWRGSGRGARRSLPGPRRGAAPREQSPGGRGGRVARPGTCGLHRQHACAVRRRAGHGVTVPVGPAGLRVARQAARRTAGGRRRQRSQPADVPRSARGRVARRPTEHHHAEARRPERRPDEGEDRPPLQGEPVQPAPGDSRRTGRPSTRSRSSCRTCTSSS